MIAQYKTDRVGFEPTRLLRVWQFSKLLVSTPHAPIPEIQAYHILKLEKSQEKC